MPAVACRLKQVLPLRRKLLEVRIVCAGIGWTPVQEELSCAFSGLAGAMALKIAASVDPT